MDNRSQDSGLELVLDNRGLIVTFALLIFVCGLFFVLGFIEGKRQGVAAAAKTSTDVTATGAAKDFAAVPATKPIETSGPETVKDQLEWYSNVNKRAQATAKLEPPPKAATAPPPAHSEASAPAASKVLFTVQVGAFRKREDAEKKAETLKSKGYQFFIDAPVEPGQPLYLLKVGKYNSRAEAVAMSLRLKRDGFSTFIKTN